MAVANIHGNGKQNRRGSERLETKASENRVNLVEEEGEMSGQVVGSSMSGESVQEGGDRTVNASFQEGDEMVENGSHRK